MAELDHLNEYRQDADGTGLGPGLAPCAVEFDPTIAQVRDADGALVLIDASMRASGIANAQKVRLMEDFRSNEKSTDVEADFESGDTGSIYRLKVALRHASRARRIAKAVLPSFIPVSTQSKGTVIARKRS